MDLERDLCLCLSVCPSVLELLSLCFITTRLCSLSLIVRRRDFECLSSSSYSRSGLGGISLSSRFDFCFELLDSFPVDLRFSFFGVGSCCGSDVDSLELLSELSELSESESELDEDENELLSFFAFFFLLLLLDRSCCFAFGSVSSFVDDLRGFFSFVSSGSISRPGIPPE